jgi:radical SAM superfamily enzyme YgiQ (UPF0313 family)
MTSAYRTEGLGIGYITAVLRRDGHDVELFDAHLRCLDTEQTIREVLKRDFECLGVSATGAHKKALIAVARAVRKSKKDVIISAGGFLPTLCTEHLFAACPELDFVVTGEGESVASDVYDKIGRGEAWQDNPGIAFLKDDKLIKNNPPPVISDLDMLPFPSRDALLQAANPPESAAIASSRGCYNRCSFCCINSFYALSGSRIPRFRRAERVVDEMESVIATTGIKVFRFVDDDFIGRGPKCKERVIRLAEEIRSRKLGATFRIECRADEVDEDVLMLLKEAGLTDVFLGVESGVQTQLNRYNKRTTVDQNKNAIEMVRRCGLNLRTGFILLDPYATLSELQENLQFIKDMKLDEDAKSAPAPFVSKMELYRGVPFVERLKQDGLLRENGIDVDYVFKDPQVRMMAKVAMVSSGISGALKSVKRLFGGVGSRTKD